MKTEKDKILEELTQQAQDMGFYDIAEKQKLLLRIEDVLKEFNNDHAEVKVCIRHLCILLMDYMKYDLQKEDSNV